MSQISTISKSTGSMVSEDPPCNGYKTILMIQDGAPSRVGKRCQVAQMIFLFLLPVALLGSATLYYMANAAVERSKTTQLQEDVDICLQLGRLVHRLQEERDTRLTLDHWSTNLTNASATLSNVYHQTDDALQNLPAHPPSSGNLRHVMVTYNKAALKMILLRLRSPVITNSSEQLIGYTTTLNSLQELQLSAILNLQSEQLWRHLVAYRKLVVSTEEVGVQIRFGSRHLETGSFKSQANLRVLLKAMHLTSMFVSAALKYLPQTPKCLKLLEEVTNFRWLDADSNFQDIYLNKLTMGSANAARSYIHDMFGFRSSIFALQECLSEEIQIKMKERFSSIQLVLGVGILLTVFVLGTCPVLVRLVTRTTGHLHHWTIQLADATKELRVEKRKSESLLYQMLPKHVAKKLKTGGMEAEYFKSCSVLFASLEEFVQLTMRLAPTEFVSLLNDLYCHYDMVISKYDVYKVETVGDVYMLSSGIPVANGHDHAAILADCALDLVESTIRLFCNSKMSLRVGINTGSCVGGVVGIRMPRYCLFGDTVNTASRMQSTGCGNRVQITKLTNKYLTRTKCFTTELRGDMEVKGKGLVQSYWLIERIHTGTPNRYMGMSVSSSILDSSLSSSMGSNSDYSVGAQGAAPPDLLAAIPEVGDTSRRPSPSPVTSPSSSNPGPKQRRAAIGSVESQEEDDITAAFTDYTKWFQEKQRQSLVTNSSGDRGSR